MVDSDEVTSEVVERVLFTCSQIHVYSIPPLTSNKGYSAAGWTDDQNARQIFTARLRILETSIPPSGLMTIESLSIKILLEDPNTGELFAGAPYTDRTVVEAAIDSSRFFAIRVVGDGGMRAVLGIGFEQRAEAIDFGICLQDCRKMIDNRLAPHVSEEGERMAKPKADKQDWSLKKGEVIRVDIGRKGRSKDGQASDSKRGATASGEEALFSIQPPPCSKPTKSISRTTKPVPVEAVFGVALHQGEGVDLIASHVDPETLGFDNGEFGEFQ